MGRGEMTLVAEYGTSRVEFRLFLLDNRNSSHLRVRNECLLSTLLWDE